MENNLIEIRIFDEDYTKIFQSSAKMRNKKQMQELSKLLDQKGISINFKHKETDFF